MVLYNVYNGALCMLSWGLKGGGGGTMLFHAFRVVYTVKELDSHAKHGQSFKKQFGRITEYF